MEILQSADVFAVKRENRLATSTTFYQLQAIHPADDRLEKLQLDKIWFSDPEKFNDPFDLKISPSDLMYRGPFESHSKIRSAYRLLINENMGEIKNHWFFDDQLIEFIEGWVNESDGYHFGYLTAQIERRFRSFGVACFTKTYDNPLMWSHYAGNHKGFCIEYSARQMDLAQPKNAIFSQFHVQYVSELPEICLSEALFAPHQVLGRMLCTKSADWAYEKEWRLVHFEKKAQLETLPKGMEISSLIAGLKMEGSDLNRLREKAALFEVPAFQIKQKGKSSLLELSRI